MTDFCIDKHHMMILADYKDPNPHKHLASHIIISVRGKINWLIGDNEHVSCRGICIGSDVRHVTEMMDEDVTRKNVNSHKTETIVFMFLGASSYDRKMQNLYLQGEDYCVLPEEVVDQVLLLWNKNRSHTDIKELDERLLPILQINSMTTAISDNRIQMVLEYLEELREIPDNIMEILCNLTDLSRSRLSHLFKEQTAMTMHSYLALVKLKITGYYIRKGYNITESCMRAGFSSSSHCAATSQRMFGISLHEFFQI